MGRSSTTWKKGEGHTRTNWKPGQSGNPNGRPYCSLRAAIREELAKTQLHMISGKRRKMTRNEIIIAVLVEHAIAGSEKAARELWDRGFGKAVQPIDMEGQMEHTGSVDVGHTVRYLHQAIEASKAQREARAQAKAKANGNEKKARR